VDAGGAYTGYTSPPGGIHHTSHLSKMRGQMRIISFIEDYKVIDKIIKHLNLTFKAKRPPPAQAQFSMTAEERTEYI